MAGGMCGAPEMKLSGFFFGFLFFITMIVMPNIAVLLDVGGER
ncbi:MAG: hypothetical protein QF828_09700 [Pseudomonadales bacterium]|nr:hypothetical protein [Pseudomonadales bacterium]